ncbi:MAG: hypothetical protein R3D33_08730 [Hyphomicrobiaceae bacterium]
MASEASAAHLRHSVVPAEAGIQKALVAAHDRLGPGARLRGHDGNPGAHGPEQFYLRHGFMKTGRLRANGTEVEIWLAP